MRERTEINGAPAWGLTELAIANGIVFARAYGVDPALVQAALYLAHIVFSKERGSEIMNNHMVLSAREAEEKLIEWNVAPELAAKIGRAIELHHSPEDSGDIYYEVVKNAECFKFLTAEGIRIFIADLKNRGMSEIEIREYARYKTRQKYGYLTLHQARIKADAKIPEIEGILNSEI